MRSTGHAVAGGPVNGPPARALPFLSDAAGLVQLRFWRWGLAACLILGAAASPLAAQSTVPYGPGQGRPSRTQGLDAPADPDPISHAQEEQMNIRRINERQKTIVADTARLLELAQELKAEVDKSNKDQLSLSVVKKAEEVEKLAKAVKEKMKGF